MTPVARARRFYWKHVRRYRYEICGNPKHRYKAIRRGCGRRVGIVWSAPTGIWNYVVAGELTTTYEIRQGSVSAYGPKEERAEGVGGVLCLDCFDREAQRKEISLKWEGENL